MISIFSLWEKFIGVANTYQGGHIKPQRQFVNWVNDISKELFNEFTDEAEKNNANNDILSPFMKSQNVPVTPLPGQFFDLIPKPSDYERFSAARIYMGGKKFFGDPELPFLGNETDILTDEEREMISIKSIESLTEITITKISSSKWAAALKHRNIRPTLESPKCTTYESGIKLAPKNIPVVVLDYYRLPVEAVFNYTISNPALESEYIAFVATGSVNLEWSPTLIPEFLTRLVRRYGKYIKERETVANTVGEIR